MVRKWNGKQRHQPQGEAQLESVSVNQAPDKGQYEHCDGERSQGSSGAQARLPIEGPIGSDSNQYTDSPVGKKLLDSLIMRLPWLKVVKWGE